MRDTNRGLIHSISSFLGRHKYHLLLIGLVQHLFIGIFVTDFDFYVQILWPINMIILAILASGLFLENIHWINKAKFLLFIAVILFPIGLTIIDTGATYFIALSIAYVLFYVILFAQVFKDMIYTDAVNLHLIIASICGFLLLIEIFVFVGHIFIHLNPNSFAGIDLSNPPTIYIDLVYYCSVTLTTIGYGDLTPLTHHAKLTASFFGILGQFYQILFLGVLISQFSHRIKKRSR